MCLIPRNVSVIAYLEKAVTLKQRTFAAPGLESPMCDLRVAVFAWSPCRNMCRLRVVRPALSVNDSGPPSAVLGKAIMGAVLLRILLSRSGHSFECHSFEGFRWQGSGVSLTSLGCPLGFGYGLGFRV